MTTKTIIALCATLSLPACNHIDDFAIPDWDSLGDQNPWTPDPFPVVQAWQECPVETCNEEEGLSCETPLPWAGEFWAGVCTWNSCEQDEDCSDLSVDVKATPFCIRTSPGREEGTCQLRCHQFDAECPEDMICAESGTFNGKSPVPTLICVRPGLMPQV